MVIDLMQLRITSVVKLVTDAKNSSPHNHRWERARNNSYKAQIKSTKVLKDWQRLTNSTSLWTRTLCPDFLHSRLSLQLVIEISHQRTRICTCLHSVEAVRQESSMGPTALKAWCRVHQNKEHTSPWAVMASTSPKWATSQPVPWTFKCPTLLQMEVS